MAGAQKWNPQKIQKLLPPLMEAEQHPNDYLPKVVSIGPYFHGQRDLALVQNFKSTAVDLFVAGGLGPAGNRRFYLNKILEIIDDIQTCYEQQPFSKSRLAGMMLDDAALIVIYMEVFARPRPQTVDHKFYKMKGHLGMLTVAILVRDLFLFQNQIPLRVIKLLINVRYGPGKDTELLNRFLNTILSRDENRRKMPSPPNEDKRPEPLHLLEASHRLFVSDFAGPTISNKNPGPILRLLNFLLCKKAAADDAAGDPEIEIQKPFHSFRTATDLKEKGIRFKPSPDDVSFTSYFLFATLRLPSWAISTHTKVLLKNMVAYELMPGSPTEGEVLSYVNLMNSLIDGPEDLKVLREKRILSNALSSDEAAARVYNGINTYGLDNHKVFGPVKQQIQEHCRSRINTWMAELFHCYFRSPWSITAFFAALSVLAISAAQLHYAVYPPPN